MTYRGYLEGADIQDAICDSFNKKPAMCSSDFDSIFDEFSAFEKRMERRSREYDEGKHSAGRDGRKVQKIIMWSILAFLLASQIVFFSLYHIR